MGAKDTAVVPEAVVVPGTETPVGEGCFGALRCVIELPSLQRRAAILKRSAPETVAAELFAAILLREWGLPVPDPFLVRESSGPAFASADAGYPSLSHRMGLQNLPDGPARTAALSAIIHIVVQLRTAALAAAADEAIDNRDRNLGNILWDGMSEAWIDHGLSLGLCPPDYPDDNKLCRMAVFSGDHSRFRESSVAQALALNRESPALAVGAMPSGISAESLAALVSARVGTAAHRLLARFPSPHDLLSAK